jgi:hypothetical protein
MHTRALVFPIINSFGGVDTLDKEKRLLIYLMKQ